MRTASALFLVFSMGAVACGGDDNAGNGAGAGGSAGGGGAASGGSAMDGGSGAGGSGGQGGTSDAGAADGEGTDDAAADTSYVDPCFGQMCGALCNSCPPSAPLCPGAIAFCSKGGQCVIGDSPK